jgi:predicted metal-dependent enzyme (double-stranded beta helix superfamily)
MTAVPDIRPQCALPLATASPPGAAPHPGAAPARPPAPALRVVPDRVGPPALRDLPDRPLNRQELLELARALAEDRDAWAPHVEFAGDRRHYVSLHRDANVDVWVICWTPSGDTGWHDHDTSAGAVAVTRGELVEHNLAVGAASIRVDVPEGHSYSFGPDHIHRMTGHADASVSIHVYSPPLWRMGQYAISASGVLRRRSVSYADELRPIEEPFPADQAQLRDTLLDAPTS